MQISKFKAVTLTAVIIIAGIVNVHLVTTLLLRNYTIHSSGSISIPQTRPLHVEGRYVKNDLGQVVYLRGVDFDAFLDTCTGDWYRKGADLWSEYNDWNELGLRDHLAELKAWGVNVIHLFMNCKWWIDDASTNLENTPTTRSYRACIKDVISIAQEYGIYIIISPWIVYAAEGETFPHVPYPPGHDGSVFANPTAFRDWWVNNLAPELVNYPNVIYCLWCEPGEEDGQDERWLSCANSILTGLRANNDQHIVMVQLGYCSDLLWVDGWVTSGKSTNNLLINQHIFRYHGTFDGYPAKTNPTYDNIKAALQSMGYEHVSKDLNLPVIVGEVGAMSGTAEFNAYNNSMRVLNEWNINYAGYTWHRPDVGWAFISDTSFTPTNKGQALIDAIAAGAG